MSVSIRVRALAYGGTFIGDIIDGPPESLGKRAFIPFVTPGEIVRAEITKEEQRFVHAQMTEFIERSNDRVEPPCPYFTRCGGCDLQHLPITNQRELKRQMIESTLKAQAGLTPVNGVRDDSAGLPDYRYRSRVTLHISERDGIGFYRAGTGEIIDIEECLIATPEINAALAVLRSNAAMLSDIAGAVLEQNGGEIATLLIPREGVRLSREKIADLRGVISNLFIRSDLSQLNEEVAPALGHFSQVNALGNAKLVATVLEWVSAESVTDLYAGSGNFSVPLAERGKKVTAVELDPALTAYGEKIASTRALSSRLTFVNSSCEKFFQKEHAETSIVLDPPRAGAKEIVKRLDTDRTKEIVYVSCNLPSLARDLKILSGRGYELVETRFVDMFSQTHHVETLSLLRAS